MQLRSVARFLVASVVPFVAWSVSAESRFGESQAALAQATGNAAALSGARPPAAQPPQTVQGKPIQEKLNPTDLTNQFLAAHFEVRRHKASSLAKEAESYRYLLIPGFLGNHIADYMGEQQRRLSALGLDAKILSIDTDGDGPGNLRRIEQAVVDSPKPVVLIGHSRGGMHSHDWYRGASPELKAKIARLVLIQAPLRGSPIADMKVEGLFSKVKMAAVAKISHWLGWGDVPSALVELTTSRRSAVMTSLPKLSAQDLAKIVVMRTTFDPIRHPVKAHRYHRDMAPLWWLIWHETGEASDGLVPEGSAKVEGAKFVYHNDLDHEDTVLQNPAGIKWVIGSRPHAKFHVGDMMEALLRVMFAK